MQRALYIFLILYFPLLAAALADLFGDFRPESLGSILFRALFFLWLFDGLGCLVTGLIVLRRELSQRRPARMVWLLPLSLVAVVLGLLPNYILVDLVLKLVEYFRLLY